MTPTPRCDPLMGPDFIRDLARRRGIEIVGGSASASHVPRADGTCTVCNGGGYLPDYARWPHMGRTLCACTAHEERRRLLSLDKSYVGLAGRGLRDLTPLPCQYASYVRASAFAVEPRGWLLMMGEYGTGKCVAASEMLTLSNGVRQLAGILADEGTPFSILTLVNGAPTPVQAHAAFNAVELVYTIETVDGRRITRNAHHPLWVHKRRRLPCGAYRLELHGVAGWESLANIQPNDWVAVTSELPAFTGDMPLPDDEIKMLAYLIGDGGISRKVVFSQEDNKQLAEVKQCVEAMGCVMHPMGDSPYDWAIVAPQRGKENHILTMLRRHGMWGKKSRDKYVPSAIFTLRRDQLCLFLSRLYATDGWASWHPPQPNSGRAGLTCEIGYCSSSKNLALDVQDLLIKLGLRPRLLYKRGVDSWTVVINDSASILRFADEIGIYGKEAAVDDVRLYASRNLDRTWKQHTWRDRNAPSGTHWEKVASVRCSGTEATVAIEVPVYHTFLTSFYEHNTAVAGALAWDACATVQPVFVKVSRLARELHDALEVARQGQAGAVGAVIDRYADAELAIFDDLGVQPDSAYVSGALMDILDTRHQDRPPRPTVITTNLSMQAIGGRLASRLTHAMVTTTVLVGDDVRATGLDDQQAAEWAPCWGDARELTDLHKKANGEAFVCAVCASRPHLSTCPVVIKARGEAR